MGLIGNGGRANANGYGLGAASRSPLNRVDDYGWSRWVRDRDGETAVLRKAGMPYGFYCCRSRYKPIEAGAMVSRFRCIVALDATASGAEGRPLVAAATLALDAAAIGGLIAGGVASATLALDGQAEISGVVQGMAAATLALDGAASIAALGHLAATGELALDGAADLYALGWMVATDDVSETLTVDGIVAGVWRALAADYNDAGTMGAELNMASAGGVDINALVDAIVAALQATTLPVDVKAINGAELTGTGVTGDEWGPA
ncbi:MAG: hypothetical protein P9F75_07335 [Candidatus Contendobacter sp.]|nr:hypothetical protein [Candidatus Contendobacter sp.]